jgi:hypothetical protein
MATGTQVRAQRSWLLPALLVFGILCLAQARKPDVSQMSISDIETQLQVREDQKGFVISTESWGD